MGYLPGDNNKNRANHDTDDACTRWLDDSLLCTAEMLETAATLLMEQPMSGDGQREKAADFCASARGVLMSVALDVATLQARSEGMSGTAQSAFLWLRKFWSAQERMADGISFDSAVLRGHALAGVLARARRHCSV